MIFPHVFSIDFSLAQMHKTTPREDVVLAVFAAHEEENLSLSLSLELYKTLLLLLFLLLLVVVVVFFFFFSSFFLSFFLMSLCTKNKKV